MLDDASPRICAVAAAFLVLGAVTSRAHGPSMPNSPEGLGYRLHSRASEARKPQLLRFDRSAGNIAVLQDDGTMIQGGLFALDRVMAHFYTYFPDTFDFVNLFGASSFPESMFPDPDASQYLARNHVSGLGMSSDLNRNAIIGMQTKRLKSIQIMSDIRRYGPTPTSPVPRFSVNFTGVELLGSEVLHAYGSFIRVDQSAGADILGRLNAHWSFFFSSGASIMEGCAWQDNGDGTFTTVDVLNEISPLDEYLFGLRPASQVPPMFALVNPHSAPAFGDATFPYPGFTTGATRVDFTIDDVIQQNGPRIPDAWQSPHEFTMVFVLVIPAGTSPPAGDVAFLEQFRSDWQNYFFEETEHLGAMTTTIPDAPVTADFEVDRFVGTPGQSVQFTARPSGAVSWLEWDFGDGSQPSGEIRPMHTYVSSGTYVAKLTVMGSNGPSVKTQTIRVAPLTTLVDNDFESGPSGWTLSPPNTAPSGRWEWGDPQGTRTFNVYAQPEDDHTPGGVHCWTTDKDAGNVPADFDVDAGVTTLRSPLFDLSPALDPHVSYARWFSNSLAGYSEEDSMTVDVSEDGGSSWVRLETFGTTNTQWKTKQFRLADFILPTSSVRFRVQASDYGGQSLVEAAFDDFSILDFPTAIEVDPIGDLDAALHFELRPNRPNPFASSTTLQYELPSSRRVHIRIYDLGGRLIRILDEGPRDAGLREIVWDGRDRAGWAAAPGVYVVRIETKEGSVARKIQLVR